MTGRGIHAFLLSLFAATVVLAADAPRIVYTKSFPGSSPAYVSVAVERSGAVSYKEAEDDDPETFQLAQRETDAIFDLAQRLDYFKRPLESGLRVANMGAKTFRWEEGAQRNQIAFNYSIDESAKELWDWFERIGESERALVVLRRAVRHDKLGVNDALIALIDSWSGNRVVGGAEFLPLLDLVAGNNIYMNIARDRAAQLAIAIRASEKEAPTGKTKAE